MFTAGLLKINFWNCTECIAVSSYLSIWCNYFIFSKISSNMHLKACIFRTQITTHNMKLKTRHTEKERQKEKERKKKERKRKKEKKKKRKDHLTISFVHCASSCGSQSHLHHYLLSQNRWCPYFQGTFPPVSSAFHSYLWNKVQDDEVIHGSSVSLGLPNNCSDLL